jgi:hypothetical protein
MDFFWVGMAGWLGAFFQPVKISLSNLSKYAFSNCQNFPFQTVKIFLSKLTDLNPE